MTNVAYVYELRWKGTNEIYVGSTSRTPEERFKEHKCRPHKCYEHLGIENAKLGRCFTYVPKHNRDREAEKQRKKEMQARGFVVLDDGDKHGMPLYWSEDAKRKQSKAQKIAQNRPDVKRKKSEALQGRTFSDEHRRNLSEAGRGKKHSTESRRKMAEAHNRPDVNRKKREARGKPLKCTWPNGRVTTYLSKKEAADDLGVSHMTIHNYLKGIKTPGGSKNTAHLRGCIFEYVK